MKTQEQINTERNLKGRARRKHFLFLKRTGQLYKKLIVKPAIKVIEKIEPKKVEVKKLSFIEKMKKKFSSKKFEKMKKKVFGIADAKAEDKGKK
jgi:hypothetical protein